MGICSAQCAFTLYPRPPLSPYNPIDVFALLVLQYGSLSVFALDALVILQGVFRDVEVLARVVAFLVGAIVAALPLHALVAVSARAPCCSRKCTS